MELWKAGNERNWDEIEVWYKIDQEQNLGATICPNIWDTLYIYYIVLTLRDTDFVTFWHGTVDTRYSELRYSEDSQYSEFFWGDLY